MRIGIVSQDNKVVAPGDDCTFDIYELFDFFYREVASFHHLSKTDIRKKSEDYAVEEIISAYIDDKTRELFSGCDFFETVEMLKEEAFASYFHYREVSRKEEQNSFRSMVAFQVYPTVGEIETANEIAWNDYFDDDDIGGS